MNKSQQQIPVQIIGGPTASGKSGFALMLAKKTNGVIINADSMQLYKELPLLTAQPSKEEMQDIPHKLYSILEGRTPCSAAHWQGLALQTIESVWKQGKTPIIVGGSGLYLQSLTQGISSIPAVCPEIRKDIQAACDKLGPQALHVQLCEIDPQMAQRLHKNDRHRIIRALEVIRGTGQSLSHWQQTLNASAIQHLQCKLLILLPPKTELHKRCEKRLETMIKQGVLQELEALLAKNYDPHLPIMKALGVPELRQYVESHLSLEEALELTLTSTKQYIKRQITWCRNQFPEAQFITAPQEIV